MTSPAPSPGAEQIFREMDLLRLATAGSVDDGKSTLIGRLLYDSKLTFEDQMAAIERSSKARGDDYVNLALLTDGLRAEREQGITIDVAYRYFATPKRKFILADTPGHVQYTRNMVTGASTANLSLLLVDARNGIREQTRRHASLSALLGIRHFVLCVNKMDLVGFDEAVFIGIRDEFMAFAEKLGLRDVVAVPISALHGDNVVQPSINTRWYYGPALLEILETVSVAADRNLDDPRFPVQYVVRPMRPEYQDYRGYAGSVAGGVFHPGDPVVVHPGGRASRIATIAAADQPLQEAYPPMSVTLRLEDDIDVSRGSMISRADNQPRETRELEATVCWMAEQSSLQPGQKLLIKHTTRSTRVIIDEIVSRLDVNSQEYERGITELALNDIGRVRLRTMEPLFVDPYERNRTTGSFILIDEARYHTLGAGMIVAAQ